MEKNNKVSAMRKVFRGVDIINNKAAAINKAFSLIDQCRQLMSSIDYPQIINALKTAAPKTARAVCFLGGNHPSELVWSRKPFKSLSFKNELYWAEYWLANHSYQLNEFRRTCIHLQSLIEKGELSLAIVKIDDYIQQVGWSLWAVELKSAIVQQEKGTEGLRLWLDELQLTSSNSIPGLLFETFADRNDDTFSYDAFFSKCRNSFPRYGEIAPWLVDYLNYRATLHIENPDVAIPNILARDITSSMIDYYEGVIDALAYIESEPVLNQYRQHALRLVKSLISNGYLDSRLIKLKFALSDTIHERIFVNSESDKHLNQIYCKKNIIINNTTFGDVLSDLNFCQQEGAKAYNEAGKLLKWGINFRGLDIGPAVSMSALNAVAPISKTRSFPLAIGMLSENFCIDDAASLTPNSGCMLLRSYLIGIDDSLKVQGEDLFKIRNWNWKKYIPDAGQVHLMLAIQLLERKLYEELYEILFFLRDKGSYWSRQCDKLQVIIFSNQNCIDDAIKLLDVWFRVEERYAIEFSGNIVFENRKWLSFKNLDPVEVGLVAHHEFEARGSSSVAYICKMACRSFFNKMRNDIINIYQSASDTRKLQLVSFLRDVWIEQNLSMCSYETTSDVRAERMAVLQLLLVWENERASEYADAIKELTIEQTLQKGLERIDQTRVFVNESAISRWAEKELQSDFNRWIALKESSSGSRAVDELIRQYVIDPSNIEALMNMAEGKPSASDALLVDIFDRLFKRFLLDPTDGLDTYLSVRIRHGSLRGTILGPLEEQGLLYSDTGFSQEAFESRWSEVLNLPNDENLSLSKIMHNFSNDIRALVDAFVNERVHVMTAEKPKGVFPQTISPSLVRLFAMSLAERPPTFYSFLSNCYFCYWKMIEIGLNQLRSSCDDLANSLRSRIDVLIQHFRIKDSRFLPLITTLTTVSTMTKSQCDTVAEWFRLPSMVSGEYYKLPDAIDIASAATHNVYRSFPANINISKIPSVSIPLTTSALAVLMDCLFVIFENAWKHSGLGSELSPVNLITEFDINSNLLSFEARSELSLVKLNELKSGKLSQLKAKYLGELPLQLINLEGGSGFPKLARLTRSVPRSIDNQPFDFGLVDGWWFTKITVPLYEREGAFEAYE